MVTDSPQNQPPEDDKLIGMSLQEKIAYTIRDSLSIADAMKDIMQFFNSEALALLDRLEKGIPFTTSTSEELDKANTHLDSRSQAHWSSYNQGYISMSDQTKAILEAEKRRYE